MHALPTAKPPIYLASSSPRRRELLLQIGVPYQLVGSEVDESPLPNEAPADYVLRLAHAKAEAGWRKVGTQANLRWLLAADTTVAIVGKILGKPNDAADATAMLRALSGITHEVLTAISVSDGERYLTRLSRSQVTMRELNDAEIIGYVASGEPMDKAGAYGIQGLGAVLIANMSGSFSGVVGLPLSETAAALVELGYPFWSLPDSAG